MLEDEPSERCGLIQLERTSQAGKRSIPNIQQDHLLVEPERPGEIPLDDLERGAGQGEGRGRQVPSFGRGRLHDRMLSAARALVLLE